MPASTGRWCCRACDRPPRAPDANGDRPRLRDPGRHGDRRGSGFRRRAFRPLGDRHHAGHARRCSNGWQMRLLQVCRRNLPLGQDRRPGRCDGRVATGAGAPKAMTCGCCCPACRPSPTRCCTSGRSASWVAIFGAGRVGLRLGQLPYSHLPVYVIDAPLSLPAPGQPVPVERRHRMAGQCPAFRAARLGCAPIWLPANSIRTGSPKSCMPMIGTPRWPVPISPPARRSPPAPSSRSTTWRSRVCSRPAISICSACRGG